MRETPSIVILGGGPAGLTASIHLSRAGIRHTLVEKEEFPRDKICGDALSGKVVSELKHIDPQLAVQLQADTSRFLGSYGVRFVAPNGKALDIPFKSDIDRLKAAPGFLARRIDFDRWLSEKLDSRYTALRTGTAVNGIVRNGSRLCIEVTRNGLRDTLDADIVIGAEGDRSVTARTLAGFKKENEHYCAGIRTYYEGVTGFHERNFIELHFIREALPGYLWIFPLANGGANVGIGMLSSVVARKRIDLKALLDQVLQEHPGLQKRFRDARRTDKMRGWGLPLGSKRRPLSGDGFLLTGDAASLIDPFTGEGIGNAMISGRLAAATVAKAVKAERFDDAYLKEYDRKVYDALWKELRLSRTLQRLSGHERLFNFVVNKATTNRTLRETITGMFDDLELRDKLSRPSFYLRLLFSGK